MLAQVSVIKLCSTYTDVPEQNYIIKLNDWKATFIIIESPDFEASLPGRSFELTVFDCEGDT